MNVIEVSRVDGRYRKILMSLGKQRKPLSIVVDPINGFIFWNENSSTKTIRRALLTGEDKFTIFNKTESTITDISLDYEVLFLNIIQSLYL